MLGTIHRKKKPIVASDIAAPQIGFSHLKLQTHRKTLDKSTQTEQTHIFVYVQVPKNKTKQ